MMGIDEEVRTYRSSTRRYFCGLKIHLLVNAQRQPIEFLAIQGSTTDVKGLRWFDLDLLVGSSVYVDRRYNNYWIGDSKAESGDGHQ